MVHVCHRQQKLTTPIWSEQLICQYYKSQPIAAQEGNLWQSHEQLHWSKMLLAGLKLVFWRRFVLIWRMISPSCCFLESYLTIYLQNNKKKKGHETGCFLQGWALIEGESWLIHGAQSQIRASYVRDYRLFSTVGGRPWKRFSHPRKQSLSTSNHELFPSPEPLHRTLPDK